MENFKLLARSMVDFFYPLLEATLFDSEGKTVEIWNPFSPLREDQEAESGALEESSCQEVLANGASVKRMVHRVYDADGALCGFLRLRYDTSKFQHLREQLDLLLHAPQQHKSLPVSEWQSSVDQLIADYLQTHQVTLPAATSRQKRELIALLHSKKLFEFKEASAYIAAKMQISRATIYNYLKTINTLQQVQIHQVDAFTDKKFGGNPAGVVLDAQPLDDVVMRKIARELNLSETSFVLPSQCADFRLRYFTPTGHEVSFCGHSTVGALFVIAREKRFGISMPGTYDFHVETLNGILKMQVMVDEQEKIRVAYQPPQAQLKAPSISHETLAEAAGIDVKLVNRNVPIMLDAATKSLFIAMPSLDGLKQMHCDFKSLTAFSKEHGIVSLCFFTNETFDPENQIHMRCFAPMVGINEDPFTGSVLGGLTAYVERFQILPQKMQEFKVEQGHFVERPGLVKVELAKGKDLFDVKVLADAVHCFSTEINIT